MEGGKSMFIMRYLVAIIAASACFVLFLVLPLIWSVWGRVPTDILVSDFALIPIYLVVVTLIATPLGIPWAATAILISQRAGVRCYAYWVASGAVAGLGVATLCVWAIHANFPTISDDGSEVSFASQWWRVSPISVAAGLMGGFIFKGIESMSLFRNRQ
jgi:hypothetical protein